MRYDNMTHNKEWFLVTPNELEEILAGFHLVIENTRVEKEHQESDLAEYIRKYSGLYAFRRGRVPTRPERFLYSRMHINGTFTVGTAHATADTCVCSRPRKTGRQQNFPSATSAPKSRPIHESALRRAISFRPALCRGELRSPAFDGAYAGQTGDRRLPLR